MVKDRSRLSICQMQNRIRRLVDDDSLLDR